MNDTPASAPVSGLAGRYDRAAPRWGDKMRVLGYADAYLGFLADGLPDARGAMAPGTRVCDVGCGTGAFAEAWARLHGPDYRITLVDPSQAMLAHAAGALARRGVQADCHAVGIEAMRPSAPFDHLLLAHVIEHVPDPVAALRHLRGWVAPGGRLWLVVSKPHWCNAIIWLQWRHRAYRAAEVAGFLAASGWHLEATRAFPSGPPSRTSQGYIARAA